jgi:hypothetical protein
MSAEKAHFVANARCNILIFWLRAFKYFGRCCAPSGYLSAVVLPQLCKRADDFFHSTHALPILSGTPDLSALLLHQLNIAVKTKTEENFIMEETAGHTFICRGFLMQKNFLMSGIGSRVSSGSNSRNNAVQSRQAFPVRCLSRQNPEQTRFLQFSSATLPGSYGCKQSFAVLRK